MRLRLGNEADCLDLQHTELRSRLPCTPHAWPEPPTARAVSFHDYGDRGVGMREQRVGKRHPGGPGTDHEIVRFVFFNCHFALL
jgi:hypothetical protein